MKAVDMIKKIKEMSEVAGAEVTQLRHGVEVYGFHKTADWKICKAKLESLGFVCDQNIGSWMED